MVTNACEFLRILADFLLSLRLLNNQFAEFLVNPMRMLRIHTNALANLAYDCERLKPQSHRIVRFLDRAIGPRCD